jgi:hypothetical protein
MNFQVQLVAKGWNIYSIATLTTSTHRWADTVEGRGRHKWRNKLMEGKSCSKPRDKRC